MSNFEDFDWSSPPEKEEKIVPIPMVAKSPSLSSSELKQDLPQRESIIPVKPHSDKPLENHQLDDNFDWSTPPEKENIEPVKSSGLSVFELEQDLSKRESIIIKMLSDNSLDQLDGEIAIFVESVAAYSENFDNNLTEKWVNKAEELMQKLEMKNNANSNATVSAVTCGGDSAKVDHSLSQKTTTSFQPSEELATSNGLPSAFNGQSAFFYQRSNSLENLYKCLDNVDSNVTDLPNGHSQVQSDTIDNNGHCSTVDSAIPTEWNNDNTFKEDNSVNDVNVQASTGNDGYSANGGANYDNSCNGYGNYDNSYNKDGGNYDNNGYGNYENINNNGGGGNRRFDREGNNPEQEAAKEELLSKIKIALDRFNPLHSETDMRGIRILTTMVAKARRLVDSYDGDRYPLYSEVFELALTKLPEEMRLKCDANEKPYKLLFGLIQVLCKQLEETMAGNATRNLSELELELSMLWSCSFCRVEGHNNNRCPRIRSMFCFNCFQFGHTQKRCINEAVVAENIIF